MVQSVFCDTTSLFVFSTYCSILMNGENFQVSSTPATRLDVVNLQEQLDIRLQQRQARETGICPVRRELYSQVHVKL